MWNVIDPESQGQEESQEQEGPPEQKLYIDLDMSLRRGLFWGFHVPNEAIRSFEDGLDRFGLDVRIGTSFAFWLLGQLTWEEFPKLMQTYLQSLITVDAE